MQIPAAALPGPVPRGEADTGPIDCRPLQWHWSRHQCQPGRTGKPQRHNILCIPLMSWHMHETIFKYKGILPMQISTNFLSIHY
jgi:hypothetical protein